MSKLVIVESPAKAKTIKRFLGSGYDVQASFGHIRDLPEGAGEIPEEYKKFKWARLGVDVDNDFQPLYVVPEDKKKYIKNLKESLKGADEILLATDEDREGESISWHVLQVLKPSSKTKVSRIVFHEITPEAIKEALRTPREIDMNLVHAQEARRILDRLYGYTLSPVLWKKVAPKLSAGRVQSVAVRFTVERERERQKFVASEYWDLEAALGTPTGNFRAKLIGVNEQRLATGKSFDPESGKLKDSKALLLDAQSAASLADVSLKSKPWLVANIETKPGQQTPPPPFMTSTLQQEASRKLRFPARRTMQIAQNLYEGIDLGGERVGLITYMRTDSLTLSQRALNQTREVIQKLYGKEYLPAQPVQYRTKSKNAQEAHEAIRPTDLSKRPQDVAPYLDKDQLAIYDLIWKRTVACQMLPARVLRTNVEVEVEAQGKKLSFAASGKQIEFSGYLKAYVEGFDDPDAELGDKETLLPPLKQGQEVEALDVQAMSHFTRPPARYTEASLIKALEESGIGRPSTYASIMGTIQDRGYIFKRGNELIPTFKAFAVIQILENHFNELVNTGFTAKMEDELDDISEGKLNSVKYLSLFYHGSEKRPGLIKQIDIETPNIPYPHIPVAVDPASSEPVVVRIGRSGAFLQRGPGGRGHTANIPPDMPPADLTTDKILELLSKPGSEGEPVAYDAATGRDVSYKVGPYGGYLEVAQSEEEREQGIKPRRISLPKDVHPSTLTEEQLRFLLELPKSLGVHPEDQQEVVVAIGPYGGYIQHGATRRRLGDWQQTFSITLEEALSLLAQPIRGAAPQRFSREASALKNFGQLEGTNGPVLLLKGRYGPYVTDGKVNATVPESMDIDTLTAEQALQLILEKAGAKPKVRRSAKGTTAKPRAATSRTKRSSPTKGTKKA